MNSVKRCKTDLSDGKIDEFARKHKKEWICAKSKTYPGQVYYFNTTNGETKWSLKEILKSEIKRNSSVTSNESKQDVDIPEPQERPPGHQITLPLSKDRVNQQCQTFIEDNYSSKICSQQIPKNVFCKQNCHMIQAFSNYYGFDPTDCAVNIPPSLSYNPNIWGIPPPILVAPAAQHCQHFNGLLIDNTSSINKSITTHATPLPLSHRFTLINGVRPDYSPNIVENPKFESETIVKRCMDLNHCQSKNGQNNFKGKITQKLGDNDLRLLLKSKKRNLNNAEINVKCNLPVAVSRDSTDNSTIQQNFELQTEIQSSNDCNTDQIVAVSEIMDENTINIDYILSAKDIPGEWDVTFLKGLAKPNTRNDYWYIVVDTNVLLGNLSFVDSLVKSDRRCRMMVPFRVQRELKFQSSKFVRCTNMAKRALVYLAREQIVKNAVIGQTSSQAKYRNIHCALGDDDILNCCLQLEQQNYHVILFSNDELFCTKAKVNNIYCFTVKEIQNYLNDKESQRKFLSAVTIQKNIAEMNVQGNLDKVIGDEIKPLTGMKVIQLNEKLDDDNLLVVKNDNEEICSLKQNNSISESEQSEININSQVNHVKCMSKTKSNFKSQQDRVKRTCSQTLSESNVLQHNMLDFDQNKEVTLEIDNRNNKPCNIINAQKRNIKLKRKFDNNIHHNNQEKPRFRWRQRKTNNVDNSNDTKSSKMDLVSKSNSNKNYIKTNTNLKDDTLNALKSAQSGDSIININGQNNKNNLPPTRHNKDQHNKDREEEKQTAIKVDQQKNNGRNVIAIKKINDFTISPAKDYTINKTVLNNLYKANDVDGSNCVAGDDSNLRGTSDNLKHNDLFDLHDINIYETLKCGEWLSRFVQIMEDVLWQLLQDNPSWSNVSNLESTNLHEAIGLIKTIFFNYRDVFKAATRLSLTIFNNSNKSGNIKINVEPKEFMKIYNDGVNLVKAFKKFLPDNYYIQIAKDMLYKLMYDIRNPGKIQSSLNSSVENVKNVKSKPSENHGNSEQVENTGSLQTVKFLRTINIATDLNKSKKNNTPNTINNVTNLYSNSDSNNIPSAVTQNEKIIKSSHSDFKEKESNKKITNSDDENILDDKELKNNEKSITTVSKIIRNFGKGIPEFEAKLRGTPKNLDMNCSDNFEDMSHDDYDELMNQDDVEDEKEYDCDNNSHTFGTSEYHGNSEQVENTGSLQTVKFLRTINIATDLNKSKKNNTPNTINNVTNLYSNSDSNNIPSAVTQNEKIIKSSHSDFKEKESNKKITNNSDDENILDDKELKNNDKSITTVSKIIRNFGKGIPEFEAKLRGTPKNLDMNCSDNFEDMSHDDYDELMNQDDVEDEKEYDCDNNSHTFGSEYDVEGKTGLDSDLADPTHNDISEQCKNIIKSKQNLESNNEIEILIKKFLIEFNEIVKQVNGFCQETCDELATHQQLKSDRKLEIYRLAESVLEHIQLLVQSVQRLLHRENTAGGSTISLRSTTFGDFSIYVNDGSLMKYRDLIALYEVQSKKLLQALEIIKSAVE